MTNNIILLYYQLNQQMIQKDWIDFYKDVIPPTKGDGLYQNESCTGSNKLAPTATSAWISNCYFYDMSSSLSGGAISFNGSLSTHFLVEKSTFVNCRMTGIQDGSRVRGTGGAIYVNISNSVLKSICCYNCYSANTGGACTVYGPNSDSSNLINYVHDSSVAYCVTDNYNTMDHLYGYIDVKSSNFSHNKVKDVCSALRCIPTSTNENGIGTRFT